MELAGISLIEADGQIFLRGLPSDVRPPVDDAALHLLLTQFGADTCVWDEPAIATASQYCNTRKDPFAIQIAQRLDAQIDFDIAADDMSAVVSTTAARGGQGSTVDRLFQALTQSGVLFGIDEAALRLASTQASCNRHPIALGVVPVDGEDGYFEELIAITSDRAPKVDEQGLIDYREHGAIPVVNPGTPLLRRIPPTPGVEGRSVRNVAVPANAGRDMPFAPGLVGVRLAEDDPHVLQAAVTGQPVRVSGGIMVESVLKLTEVNMATGNIHFDGTVHIEGDVVQGMKVQASGDIVVGGMVDSGVLEAGGDIRVTGGVIAHAKLTAAGCVSARFAQGVAIHAGRVIALSDMALECELQSLNQIIIGAEAPGRARLVGGGTTAMMLVRVPLLGSAKGAATKLVLGANAQLTAQYESLQKRIQQEKETEENLDKLVRQVSATGDPKGMLPRIKASRQHAIQVWGQSLAERERLEQQMALALGAQVEVGAAVAGAVDITFGNHTARLRREFGTGKFRCDQTQDMVVFTDALGHTIPAV